MCLCGQTNNIAYPDYPVPIVLSGSWSGGGSFTFDQTGGAAAFMITFPGVGGTNCCVPTNVTVNATFQLCNTSGDALQVQSDSTAHNSCPVVGGAYMSGYNTGVASLPSSSPPLSMTIDYTKYNPVSMCYSGGTMTITE
jgi:hypothetical protein